MVPVLPSNVPAWAANGWWHNMRAVVLALSLLLPRDDLAWLDTTSQEEPSANPLVLGPGCAQTAQLQGIQAEAALGVEQGLKFWCTLCGFQQTATMGRLWPGRHLPSVHSAQPETGQPQLTSALRQLSTGLELWGEQDASPGSGARKEAKPPQTNQPGQ